MRLTGKQLLRLYQDPILSNIFVLGFNLTEASLTLHCTRPMGIMLQFSIIILF